MIFFKTFIFNIFRCSSIVRSGILISFHTSVSPVSLSSSRYSCFFFYIFNRNCRVKFSVI